MAHLLTIEVPDPLSRQPEKWAIEQGTTPEDLATSWIARQLLELGEDPLLKWAGAIGWDAADVARRHDEYLG